MRRRLRATLGAAALATTAVVLPLSTQSAAADATPTNPDLQFGVPRIVDPIHTFGEPDIKVGPVANTPGGYPISVSGPAGTGTQRSVWDISTDGGDSYRTVYDIPQGQAPAQAPAKETNGPGGGDTEIVFDHTGKMYYNDLYALACFTAGTTPDNGATVASNANGCSDGGSADRQWMGLYDPKPGEPTISAYTGPKPLQYMEYNDGGGRVDRSTDGLNFTLAGSYAESTGNNEDSPIVVDQYTGKVLAGMTQGGNFALAEGTPDATGNLTFAQIDTKIPTSGSVHSLFPVTVQDSNRNVYIVYVPQSSNAALGTKAFHVYYIWAAPGADNTWSQWHGPYRVDNVGDDNHTALMPWAAAGADGNLDVVWYDTNRVENPSKVDSSNPKAWNVEFAQINAADSDAPAIEQTTVTPHPFHYNSICISGTGCITSQGDRNLADFFEVTLDPDGRAHIVYPDTSNGLIQTGFSPGDGLADHHGAPLVTTVTQMTGRNAWTGAPLSATETRDPSSTISDPTKDSLVDKALGGTYAQGADITDVAVSQDSSNLVFTVKTAGSSLGAAAQAAQAAFGQLVIRWQSGNTLYYAEAEQPAAPEPVGSAATQYYAGATQSIDLCSVSACEPHYLTYPGAANGGNSVTGTTTSDASGTTYTIKVPLSDVGNPSAGTQLEELGAYVFAAPQSANTSATNAQAEAEQGVPTEIEGTRTINYLVGGSVGAELPESPVVVLLPATAVGVLGLAFARRRRRAA